MQPTKTPFLRRLADRADAEMWLRDGHAWVIAVGTVDATRASAVADLVNELTAQRSLRRVSVDLTCTVAADHDAAAILENLRADAPPSTDVTTAGVFGRLGHRRAA